MRLGIDPKVDYAFKFLFGREQNTQPLIHLLHSILKPTPDSQIAEVTILNPFTSKMSLDEKLAILDIRARDQLGRQFNLEMQMLGNLAVTQRFLYYWGKLYTQQLQTGEEYELLKPTISLCFVDAVLFPGSLDYHHTFRLIDDRSGLTLTNDLSIHVFELPKFGLGANELVTPLDGWLYFLRYAEGMDPERLPETLNTTEIRQAMEVLMSLTQVDIDREVYEGRMKRIRDEKWLSARAAEYESAMAEKEKAIAEQEKAIAEQEKAIAEQEKAIAEQEKAIAEQEQAIAQQEKALAEREQALAVARDRILSKGHTEGRAAGELIGRIVLAQKLLRRDGISRTELDVMTPDALERLAAQLERELME